MPELKGSVGQGGRNISTDVSTVQTFLKQRLIDVGRVDGICGIKTIAAIKLFQKSLMSVPDGRVDPGGPTWRSLSAGPQQPLQPAAQPRTGGDWSGDSARWTQEKKLLSLEPNFRSKVQTVLSTLIGQGFHSQIVFGWRSVAVQQQLFNEGKTKVHFSFHNAQRPDGTPNAYAADIIDERWGWETAAETNGFWIALGSAAKVAGLVWGGDWKSFPDVAHIQGRQNSELAAVKRESGL